VDRDPAWSKDKADGRIVSVSGVVQALRFFPLNVF